MAGHDRKQVLWESLVPLYESRHDPSACDALCLLGDSSCNDFFFFFFINVIKVVFILSLSSLPLSYTYSTLSFLSNTLYPEGTIYTSCYVSFSFFNSARVRWKNACSAPRFIKAKSLYYSISASGWEWKIFMLNNYFSYLNILFSNCHKLI